MNQSDTRLAAKGGGAGLAAIIPPGMRAVAVRVNDIFGVAGFVIPGTKVDLLIAGTPPKGNGGLGDVTKTLLQNVEVVSVPARTSPKTRKASRSVWAW